MTATNGYLWVFVPILLWVDQFWMYYLVKFEENFFRYPKGEDPIILLNCL